ncbi:MAG: serine hydrolase domain-containing protein [Pseudomonadota bacterium]
MAATIHGTCAPKFEAVKAAFATNFAMFNEIGASVAVSQDGDLVVDLWGGHLDEARSQPWQENTLVNVWSSTKPMAAMCLLILADGGDLDLHAPVSKYWPEFSQNGKGTVEVRHFLSHSAGLSGMDEPVDPQALYDWNWMTDALARQAPWWEPGTQSGYHALTQGYLIGEIVRRVTGQSLGTFYAQEIAGPLGADFHIGTTEVTDARVANVIPPTAPIEIADDNSIGSRTFRNPAVDAKVANTRDWRAAEIPAANGQGNARAIVRAQTPMACGGEAFGRSILSGDGTRRVFEKQTAGLDLALGIPVTFGMGYGISSEPMPLGPNPNIAYWGGYGGSIVLIDQDANLCFSYVMNRMESGLVGDLRGFNLLQAMYLSLA